VERLISKKLSHIAINLFFSYRINVRCPKLNISELLVNKERINVCKLRAERQKVLDFKNPIGYSRMVLIRSAGRKEREKNGNELRELFQTKAEQKRVS